MFDADDRRFMKQALALARKGLGAASPNPSVGCLIVRNGRIVGRAHHEYEQMDHAEVRALREAAGLSRDATAYVTLEPCCHQGRTPPCADLLIECGIRRVVVARIDPNPRVSGRGADRLRNAGVQVDVGLMEEEAGEIIEPFACRIVTELPLVVSKAGMSMDGKIGTAEQRDRQISSPEGREFAQRLRLCADAVLVGVGTVLSDDPELTYRGSARKSRPLVRVILDSTPRTPASARLLRSDSRSPILIFCSPGASNAKRVNLEKQGAEILAVRHSESGLDLHAVLQELGKREILELLVEGGSHVHWSFVSNRLVDKLFLIIAPVILGGENAIPSVGGKGYGLISDAPRFKIRKSSYAGPDIVLEAYPAYSRSIISPWLPQENAPSGVRDPVRSSRRK